MSDIEAMTFEGFEFVHSGKVRDVHVGVDEHVGEIILDASDRLSAFDAKFPEPIPNKGKILNEISAQELLAAEEAGIPTWFNRTVGETASAGALATPFPIEMVFRRHMTGSMWRSVQSLRADAPDDAVSVNFFGVEVPDESKEWEFLRSPGTIAVDTPTTKGDEDIPFNPSDVTAMTGVTTHEYAKLLDMGRRLFALGEKRAAERGLVLVDTKYEMGMLPDGRVVVIDEVHTPDSSRFVESQGFIEAAVRGQSPRQLSKESVRERVKLQLVGELGLSYTDKEIFNRRAREIVAEGMTPQEIEETAAVYQELYDRWVA